MKVAYLCPSCGATVTAPASLQGESAPCPRCQVDIDRWPAPIAAPGVVRIVPPPAEPAGWYYAVNGAQRGPATSAQLRSLVESGALRGADLVWRAGLPAWVEAGTVPELFPAGARLPPVPIPPPAEPDGRRRTRSADDQRPIHVHVKQVIERDDERPRRRRRCPYCDSPARPVVRRRVTAEGWVVFALLLFFTIIFCFIGLLITEDVAYCPDCGVRC